MEAQRFDHFSRLLGHATGRRRLVVGLALGPFAGLVGQRAEDVAAKKKHKKKHHHKHHKRTQECAKAGSTPAHGASCCAGTVLVDGACQACDVCKSGCPFTMVQAAIAAASAGATIAICPGTYRENLEIDQDVRLVGAGKGEGAGDTIVQGTGDDSVVTSETNGIVKLERLRLTGGDSDYGGGIFNDSVLTLTDCTVSGNTAGTYGGGIYNNAGTVTLDAASRVTGNTAGVDGGGIYNSGGTVTLVTSANVTDNDPINCAGLPAVPLCGG